jgi:hypothetical protein
MALSVINTAYYEGLTLETIEKMILFELGQVVGTEVSYNRFPQWLIRQKLNIRQQKFVFLSQCLKKSAIITLKADYHTFKLPLNCMDGGIIGKPKFYRDTDDYINLEIKTTQWLDDHYEGWKVEDSSEPQYCYLGESYGNTPMIGIYPRTDTDGDDYATDPDTGITIGEDFPGTITNVTGLATGGNATTLTDTTVDFTTLGLVAGMTVNNVTDGSTAAVSSVATNSVTITTLTGGSANTFSAGDSYEILAGEYGVVTTWTDTDQVLFASEVGEIANITVPKGNLLIDYIPYPLAFPESGNVNQYPEIPKLYHPALVDGVVADLLGSFHENSKEFQRGEAYEAKFNASAMTARSKKEGRPFKDHPKTLRPAGCKMRRR